ncbi:MAG TPA: dephospho-CoA kinase [Longimicrobiales bacterium]|nr:dephospho-CoA kinase [Longimicrobiales bacterium]
MLSVALTGNVASGKSTVAERWAGAGIPVVSADELSRRAVLPGSPALREIRQEFGEAVIAPDGTLDRARMRELVFGDDRARERLERILHPVIRALRAAWIEERRRAGHTLVVSEIPLLFETGGEREFDLVVLVDAPAPLRLERLVRTRGLGQAEARRIMDAQMDSAPKRAVADIVIDNDGSLEELDGEATRVLEQLRRRAGGTVRLDLHLHTRGSHDCLSDPEEVLRRALALGYARIAITDHDRLGVALRMSELHPDRIIAGEEVKTREGIDVIGLYLTQEIPKGTPARETIERIHGQGGIAYLPHPYAPGKGGGGRAADELAPLCDVVEVFNARLHDSVLNRRAEELAARHGKPRGAGSDAHTVREIGNAFVDVPPHANRPDALLRALAGAAGVGGTSASRLVHLASTWAKVRKKLPGGR